jgi:RNA polymerase sigma factor (sigma-70 family)
MNSILKTSNVNDSELTARAVAGQRDAFGQIVSRYQSLVCSLAYSATGSLSQSEDLAQETFIAAWKGLQTLQEPEKLRPWLCSIARNIIANAVRHRMREPMHAAESLDTVPDLPSPESLPVDRAISREEESILWRSLEHVPQIYREPLVLFYREGKSIESVAQELELSDEAVKQRLSRGRKLLKMEVEAFVEAALRQSAPGREFTSTVLAVLPALSFSAEASAVGAASSKGFAAAKTGSFANFIGGMLAPILATLGGFLSLIGFVKGARSARERSLTIKSVVIVLCVFVLGQTAYLRFRHEPYSDIVWIVQFIANLSVLSTACILVTRLRKKIQIEEGRVQQSADSHLPLGCPESKAFKWNMYSVLFVVSFGNPFALLTVWAAKAHDSIVLFAMLAILAAAFILSRRILIQKPEQTLNVWRVVMIGQFVLLLTVIHLRWEIWTGQSPWQFQKDVLLFTAIGFLLFAFASINWLAKRNR